MSENEEVDQSTISIPVLGKRELMRIEDAESEFFAKLDAAVASFGENKHGEK